MRVYKPYSNSILCALWTLISRAKHMGPKKGRNFITGAGADAGVKVDPKSLMRNSYCVYKIFEPRTRTSPDPRKASSPPG